MEQQVAPAKKPRAKAKAKAKKVAIPKGEGKKRIGLIKEADAWASRFVRLRDMRDDGLVPCYTCSSVFTIQQIQCGHFVGRAHYSTRWDARNMHAQCQRCNKFRSGEPGAYAYRLLVELGQNEFTELLMSGLQSRIVSDDQLRELILHFREQVNHLLRVKNVRPWW